MSQIYKGMASMYTVDGSVSSGGSLMSGVTIDLRVLNQRVMNEINLALKQQGISLKEVMVLPLLDDSSPYSGTIHPNIIVPKILFLKEVSEEVQDRVYRLIVEEIRKVAGIV